MSRTVTGAALLVMFAPDGSRNCARLTRTAGTAPGIPGAAPRCGPSEAPLHAGVRLVAPLDDQPDAVASGVTRDGQALARRGIDQLGAETAGEVADLPLLALAAGAAAQRDPRADPGTGRDAQAVVAEAQRAVGPGGPQLAAGPVAVPAL